MHATLTTLIDRLDSPAMSGTDVLPWGSPVPSFGDLSKARVATLGLNPSNLEFVDRFGRELQGPVRRFHTLGSLGLATWADADARHLRLIISSCQTYFHTNPYDGWFKRLDQIIAGTMASYYSALFAACHLDLIPYATTRKWTNLESDQRAKLLSVAGDTLALLLRDSPVRILILNGRTVVDHFQSIAGVHLEELEMSEWALPRRASGGVRGFAYRGWVDSLLGITLKHRVLVLGFNHNLQSSFGVTTGVMAGIRDWISRTAAELVP